MTIFTLYSTRKSRVGSRSVSAGIVVEEQQALGSTVCAARAPELAVCLSSGSIVSTWPDLDKKHVTLSFILDSNTF